MMGSVVQVEITEAGDTDTAPGVVFHAAAGLGEAAIAAVQAPVRRRILRVFLPRGLIGKCDAEEMAGWDHGGGFSVDAAVRIEGSDRAGLERLLRSCARPSPSNIYAKAMPSIEAITVPSQAPTRPVIWY